MLIFIDIYYLSYKKGQNNKNLLVDNYAGFSVFYIRKEEALLQSKVDNIIGAFT